MNKTDFANHIKELTDQYNITVGSHSRDGKAYKRDRIIWIRPVKSAITYAVALHEIGHILGPWQSQPRLFSEAGAWKWAMENAEVWTEVMHNCMVKSLQGYLDWALEKNSRNIKNAPIIPLKNHEFWDLLERFE